MWKNIGEIWSMLSIAIGAVSDLLHAGRCQTTLIKEQSEFDVDTKRAKLKKRLAEFIAEQEAETPAIPEFKVA